MCRNCANHPSLYASSTHLHTNTDVPIVPIEILQTHWRKRHGSMIKQVCFRWSNSDAVTDRWEDKLELHTRFPATAAWGKPPLKKRGMSAALSRRTRGAARTNASPRLRARTRPGNPTQESLGRPGLTEAQARNYLRSDQDRARASSGSQRRRLGYYPLPPPLWPRTLEIHSCNLSLYSLPNRTL